MISGPKLIARVALFSALIYVLSLATSYLPNIKLIFFIVFSAGFLWGIVPGLLVGAIGMGLWTLFNPYGPAGAPVMLAQVVGAALGGLVGALARGLYRPSASGLIVVPMLIAAAFLCTLLYYLPVTVVDAWVYQPFWPRFIAGLPWVLISLGSNVLIFPLLFSVTRFLYSRETRH